MARFVVAHGAWSAGWAWKKMRPLCAAAGHELFTPTWTGIGERRHLVGEHVNLSTHIADLVQHMEVEDHSDVVLLAHSYGGWSQLAQWRQLSTEYVKSSTSTHSYQNGISRCLIRLMRLYKKHCCHGLRKVAPLRGSCHRTRCQQTLIQLILSG